MSRKLLLISSVVGLILLLVPLFTADYVIKILIMAGIYIGLASSLNLIFGVAGLLNLGHAAFYGIGAYTAAILSINFQVPFIICLIVGSLVAALSGYLIAFPTSKLRGIFFAVSTLAFGEIMRLVFLNWITVTRGPMGITGIPYPSIFGFEFDSNGSQYYLLMAILVVVLFVLWRISYSPFGMTLRSVRENEEAAETLGIKPHRYKSIAFTISAGTAGLLGGFFAFHVAYINPLNFQFMESITLLAMVVVGGLGSMPGVIIGAVIFSVAPEILRFMAEYRMVIYGLIMVIMILWRPQGIISESVSLSWARGNRNKPEKLARSKKTA